MSRRQYLVIAVREVPHLLEVQVTVLVTVECFGMVWVVSNVLQDPSVNQELYSVHSAHLGPPHCTMEPHVPAVAARHGRGLEEL